MDHDFYMRRALDLASNGLGRTSPNPAVGCVIVHEGKVIGEGWHREAGTPHAEVVAINSVEDHNLLKHSTLYVTLEPCSHFGRTPPCSQLIVEKSVNKVVIATEDPNLKVGGSGIKHLLNHGIEVVTGILSDEASEINSQFLSTHSYQQLLITLKWAQSADGFIDPRKDEESRGQIAVSGPVARVFTHKLRAMHDAILVGTNTFRIDKPGLNIRHWHGRHPLKVIIDRQLKFIDELDQNSPALVLTEKGGHQRRAVEIIRFDFDDWKNHLNSLLQERNIQSLLVEGGADTLNRFMEQDFWNRAFVYINNKRFENGLEAPAIPGEGHELMHLGSDRLMLYRR